MCDPYMLDIIGFGKELDIMPLVLEAIERCKLAHDFSAHEVADLVSMKVTGRYIPVDTQDRIEDRNIEQLTSYVILRVRSAHRIEQIMAAERPGKIQCIELRYFDDIGTCKRGSDLAGRWLSIDELELLPLTGCDQRYCMCSYHASDEMRARRLHPDWVMPVRNISDHPT